MDEEIREQLEKEYCPPLDTPLLYAVLADYSPEEPRAVDHVRTTLDILRTAAEAVENTAFDPSGSYVHDEISVHGSKDQAKSSSGDVLSRSDDTGITSLDHSLKSLEFEDHAEDGDWLESNAAFEGISTAEKEAQLSKMFPNLKQFDINYTLKKQRYDWGKTVEELLNYAFLQDYQSDNEKISITKGVDGFVQDRDSFTSRKRKGKKRKEDSSSSRSSSAAPPHADKDSNRLNVWDTARQDVEYIIQRTGLSTEKVNSLYHECKTSLSATILALCTYNYTSNPIIELDDPLVQAHATDLSSDFPSIPFDHLTRLISLTHPSTASAHELARAMTSTRTTPLTDSFETRIIPQYAHPPPSPPLRTTSPPPRSLPITPITTTRPPSRTLASTPKNLLAAASPHYNILSRAAALNARASSTTAAAALAASQSTPTSMDLHGISVADGVRLARSYVQEWWDGGEKEWAREGKVQGTGGYQIVVGRGTHSEGGKGKLGPAVGKMLVREGWRVEVGDGVLSVRGRARR